MAALPSLKTLGNRVLRECAVPEVSSFNPGNVQSNIAFDALLDGYADIWFRNRWEWQRYEASIQLAQGVDEYALPANFHRMAINPWFPPNRAATQLREYSPEEFYNLTTSVDTTQTGQPLGFTIDHTTLKLWPAPSSGMITNAPAMTFQYWMQLPARKAVSAESYPLDYMPAEFNEILTYYAKSKLKEFLEYPDFERDMQVYEKKLGIMMNRNRQVRTAPRMRTAYDGVKEW